MLSGRLVHVTLATLNSFAGLDKEEAVLTGGNTRD